MKPIQDILERQEQSFVWRKSDSPVIATLKTDNVYGYLRVPENRTELFWPEKLTVGMPGSLNFKVNSKGKYVTPVIKVYADDVLFASQTYARLGGTYGDQSHEIIVKNIPEGATLKFGFVQGEFTDEWAVVNIEVFGEVAKDPASEIRIIK